MAIDFLSTLGNAKNKAFGSTVLSSMFGNTLMVSLIISVVLLLLMLAIYPVKKNTPWTKLVKILVYLFMTTLVVVFMHDGIVRKQIEDEYLSAEQEQRTNEMPVYSASRMPVIKQESRTTLPMSRSDDVDPEQTDLSTEAGSSLETAVYNDGAPGLNSNVGDRWVTENGQLAALKQEAQAARLARGATEEKKPDEAATVIAKLGGTLYAPKAPAVGSTYGGNPFK